MHRGASWLNHDCLGALCAIIISQNLEIVNWISKKNLKILGFCHGAQNAEFYMVNITKIKALGKSKGITTTFICNSVGMGAGYLNDVAKGKCVMPDERLKTIADVLGTTPEYLQDMTDEPAPRLSDTKKKLIDSLDGMTDEQLLRIQALIDMILSK